MPPSRDRAEAPLAPLFAADPAGSVETMAMDGLVALFHHPSGMTHIVAPPAPEILEALREGPADAAAILSRMRARYDLDADGAGDAEGAVAARLAELEAAGLVWRPCATA